MKTVNKNISYQLVTQLMLFGIPLLTFPYLTRVLGVESYGTLVFYTALLGYVLLICQFGFNLSATQFISKNREFKTLISRKYFAVIVIQMTFFLLSLAILFLLLSIIKIDTKEIYLCLYLSIGIFGQIFTPIWLFQGVELLKNVTIFLFIGRLITIPVIFVLIKEPDDIYLVAVIQGLGVLVSCVLSNIFLMKNKVVKYTRISFYDLKTTLYESWELFIVTASSNLYNNTIPVILGITSGAQAVAYFTVARTIKTVITKMFNAIFQSIYPRIVVILKDSKSKASEFIIKYLKLSATIAFVTCVTIALFSKKIILIMAGSDYLEASSILSLLTFAIFMSVINNFFGVQTLIPLGYKRVLMKIVLIGGLVSVITLVPLTISFGAIGAAITVCIAELLIFVLLVKSHLQKNLKIIFR